MEKYIDFLETTDVNSLENTIKDFSFYKYKSIVRVSCQLECKEVHLQHLKDLGIKFDFSNKRVGFAWNQNTVSGTGNNLRIACQMELSVFKLLAKYLRDDFRANLLNDQQLVWRGFPLKTKQSQNSIPLEINLRIEELKSRIRRKVHARGYKQETYSSKLIQNVLNK